MLSKSMSVRVRLRLTPRIALDVVLNHIKKSFYPHLVSSVQDAAAFLAGGVGHKM